MLLDTDNVPDNVTFVSTIQQNYLNLSIGGISIDTQTGDSLFAWQASPPGLIGPTMMNLVTNILYNRALNASGDTAGTPSIIMANYASFPRIAAGTLTDLKWVAFFGAAMVCAAQEQYISPSADIISRLSSPHSSPFMSLESGDQGCKPCSCRTVFQIQLGFGSAISCGTRYSQ